jgi:hypothetical protein
VEGSTADPGADREISIPSTALVDVPLPQPGGSFQLDGSLGSDVLSKFHSVVIDYRDAALLLGGPPPTS